MNHKTTIALLGGALAALISGTAVAAPSIVGYWLKETEDPYKSAIIEIYPDGKTFDGRVLQLKYPRFVEGEVSSTGEVVPPELVGEVKTDVLNPTEILRKRPIEGLKLIEGFKPAGDGEWKDATIYNPEDGKTYQCKAELSDDGNTLEVRGFVGFALLGRTQTWTRLASPEAVGWARPDGGDADVESADADVDAASNNLAATEPQED